MTTAYTSTAGDTFCLKCGREWSDEVKCCCSYASFDDGTHEEGYCIECCPNPHESRQAGIGGYERMDCDQ